VPSARELRHGVRDPHALGAEMDASALRLSVLNWRSGDTIPLGAGRTLCVVDVRDDVMDEPPILVVGDASE
jgi:hypothetical protein